MKNNKIKWRKLDNSAKIFPMSTGEKYSTVFRISVLLKDEIKPEILEQAVKDTLKKLCVLCLPVTLSGLIIPLTQLVDSVLVLNLLKIENATSVSLIAQPSTHCSFSIL